MTEEAACVRFLGAIKWHDACTHHNPTDLSTAITATQLDTHIEQ